MTEAQRNDPSRKLTKTQIHAIEHVKRHAKKSNKAHVEK